MEDFLMSYKRLQTINYISEIAYNELFYNLLILNLKGYDKIQEIDDFDNESVIDKITKGFPVVGNTYTFIHTNKLKESIYDGTPTNLIDMVLGMLKSGVTFIDVAPIVLVLESTKSYIRGLNLNLLPPNLRLDFLQLYYKIFNKYFQNIDILLEENKPIINTELISISQNGNINKFLLLLQKELKFKVSLIYRTYNIGDISNLRMIEVTSLKYLPFYNAQRTIKDVDLQDLWKLITKN